MSCEYCESEKNLLTDRINNAYIYGGKYLGFSTTFDDRLTSVEINYCPMCGRCLKQRLTPAQENAHKGSPLRSSHKPIDSVVDAPENAVQPVFHIGDTIRFKSTGRIEKITEITYGARFINSVDVNDVEKL